jgi:hypothetical protein
MSLHRQPFVHGYLSRRPFLTMNHDPLGLLEPQSRLLGNRNVDS